MAVSRAELSAPFADGCGSICVLNNDQRPANSMLATFILRRRFPMFRPNVGRLFDGTRSARNPSKLSEVTRPSAASCDKASSTCEGSRPLRRTSSAKKSAPPVCSASKTVWRRNRDCFRRKARTGTDAAAAARDRACTSPHRSRSPARARLDERRGGAESARARPGNGTGAIPRERDSGAEPQLGVEAAHGIARLVDFARAAVGARRQ